MATYEWLASNRGASGGGEDVDKANLDRIQIIKGWLDGDGKTHEAIYDVAVSDGRTIGRDGRCKTFVGSTVEWGTNPFPMVQFTIQMSNPG